MPNTNAKSATFEPRIVPKPNSGIPLSAEIIEIVASGNAEIIATMKKLTMNSERWNLFANLEE